MKKWIAVAVACALAACNSGGPITGPTTDQPVAAPETTVAAAPATQPVAPAQDPKAAFEVDFRDNAGFRVNYVGDSGARVVAFITSFDDQDTPLASKQRDLTANQAWEDTFAAQCVQLDIDQPGVKLIAAAFYDKSGKWFKTSDADAGAKISACRCEPEWIRAEQEPEIIYGDWVVNGCSKSRTRTYRYTETQTCTNAKRTVDESGKPEIVQNELDPSFTLGSLTYPTYTPAVYSYTSYFEMKQGSETARRNACQNRGGTWLNDYNIPNDGTGSERPNVCRFVEPNPPGAPGNDMTLYNPPGVVQTLVSAASGGNPISGHAHVANAGTWKLVLKAQNPGNYDKDIATKTLVCGESADLDVSYNWVGHSSEDWFLVLYLNNSLLAQSPTIHNPSN